MHKYQHIQYYHKNQHHNSHASSQETQGQIVSMLQRGNMIQFLC